MSAEYEMRKGEREPTAALPPAPPAPPTPAPGSPAPSPAPSPQDDAIRALNDILKRVGAGLQPRPLGPEAEQAVARYDRNRATLDHDIKRPGGTP